MDSNLEKSCKLFFDFLFAIVVCGLIPVFFSPVSETLALVSMERLFIYALCFGSSFLIFGEILGVREQSFQFGLAKNFLFSVISSFLSVLALLLIVWAVEYSFIGRFAIGKILFGTAIVSFITNFLISNIFSSNPTKCVLLLSNQRKKAIIEITKERSEIFQWFNHENALENEDFSIQSFCNEHDIDLLVIDDENTEQDFNILQVLAQGTQVIGFIDFWQKYIGCIPPSEITQSWLSKLDLRIRNPVALKIKRGADILLSILALLITSPVLLIVFLMVAIESGFPLIFSQTRTGFLSKDFTIYKIRSMKKNAEKEGAEWASENDERITKLGSILRKLRIDEIPQFWNVIKGDMSIVGPRPERPEFQEDLLKNVPHWNARHLVKPGITGWAQIKYKYASNMQSSEQKLAYDLYYLGNLSFALDFEIILATLRSIGKGSR